MTVTNATTAAVATTVTITDNESTNEDNAIIFTSGGDVDGGNIGLESDGDLTYNPSTGTLTSNKVKILTTDNTAGLTLECTDDDADDGPIIDLYRNSANPSDNDHLGKIVFSGQDGDSGNKTTFVEIATEARDLGTTEDARLDINLVHNGTLTNYLQIDTEQDIVFNEGGDDIDFRIESDDNANMFFVDAGQNQVNIGTDTNYGGVLNVLSTDNDDTLVLISTDADANNGPVLNMRRDSSSPADNDILGAITFDGEDSGDAQSTYAIIRAKALDVSSASEDGQLQFIVDKDGTLISGLDIGSSEAVFNEDSAAVNLRVESNGNANMLFVDGTNDRVGIARNDPAVTFDVTGTGRFSAGVLFGTDTAAENTLDDYEEGTFTPSFDFATSNASAGSTAGKGRYVKIGSLVTVYIKFVNINVSGADGDTRIQNLPFTSLADSGDGSVGNFSGTARVNQINYGSNAYVTSDAPDNTLYVRLIENLDNTANDIINAANCSDGTTDVYITLTYPTAS